MQYLPQIELPYKGDRIVMQILLPRQAGGLRWALGSPVESMLYCQVLFVKSCRVKSCIVKSCIVQSCIVKSCKWEVLSLGSSVMGQL